MMVVGLGRGCCLENKHSKRVMNDVIVNCQLSRTGTYRSASIIETNTNVTSICTSAGNFFGSFLQVYPSTIGTIHHLIKSYLLVK